MFGRVSLGAVAFAAVFIANSVSADTLRMGGVGASAAMLPPLFAAFNSAGEHKLEVIPALGSSGGLRAAADGVLDLVVSGRALKADEKAQGLTPILTIRSPFGLVTSRSQPGALKSMEIASIYQSAKAAWPDGSPVRIILRPTSDSDTPLLGSLFPRMEAALEQARKRGEISVAATDQDNADMAETVPGSLAGSTFTQVQVERRKLNFIAIDGVEPSLENLERGTYPFAKTLYFVLPAKKNLVAERFVAFLTTPEGRAALRLTGNLPTAD